jgi:putative membrane protein
MKIKALYLSLLVCVITGISRFHLYDASAEAHNWIVTNSKCSEEDMKFAKEAAEGGMMEVKLGQYAMTHATSEKVKMLGKMMYEDHTKANEELKELAAKKGITLPTELGKEKMDKVEDMMKKSGDEFDKDYSEMMVKDHKKDIKLFEDEAKGGKDADIKSWASGKIPTLKHHLEMAESTCDALKKGTK